MSFELVYRRTFDLDATDINCQPLSDSDVMLLLEDNERYLDLEMEAAGFTREVVRKP